MIVHHSTTQSLGKLELLKIPPNQEEPKLWKIKYDSSCEKYLKLRGTDTNQGNQPKNFMV